MKERRWFVSVLLAAVMLIQLASCGAAENVKQFQNKAELLRQEALSDWIRESLGEAPAGQAGYAVFFSVCDGENQASVFTGTGPTLDKAWDTARTNTRTALEQSGLSPKWVKADLVYYSEILTLAGLEEAAQAAGGSSLHYGLSFDEDFHTALLEGQLNAGTIFDKETGGISLEQLNECLQNAGREELSALPETCRLFGAAGWLCDEENRVWNLNISGPSTGRRSPEQMDGNYARQLVQNAAVHLANLVREDGSFSYGWYPASGQQIEGGGTLDHAGALWALLCAYRVSPNEALAAKIDLALDYMLNQIGFDPEGRAFLMEANNNEIKLGGNALALLALTEYAGIFQDTSHLEDCRALGGGIISMMDPETGAFVHVLNGDLTLKEDFRTVYYDGEAAFALARLYGLTGEQIWLEAAQRAVDRMVAEDYAQYKDHWVAYAMSEITKYVTDRPEYYSFALENAQENLKEIYEQQRTQPVYLELLMSAFEVYDRLTVMGGSAGGFQSQLLLAAIYARADRQLDGYLYPEYAMYMSDPGTALNAFMSPQDGFRIRIDDLQHNICGFYLFAKNYDRLLAAAAPAPAG